MIHLNKISTKAPKDISEKDIRKKTEKLHKELSALHKMMRAEEKHSILIVFQAMDCGGKDGSVASLYNGLFPVATNVHSFKAPTEFEKAKGYLWRVHYNVPSKGNVTIFNRSHYEDILVPTVHKLFDKSTIKKRYKHINDFEEMLKDNGTTVLKFYLHISKHEQKERFKERYSNIEKKWKYSSNDIEESKLWGHYMDTYENIFHQSKIKWHVIPADDKWYRDYLIAKTLVETMRGLKMNYPNVIK